MAFVKASREWTGILLVNKPRERTSFSMVGAVRRLSDTRKVGHVGTLDPFAEGLLPVCIGRATAAVQFMTEYDKTYRVRAVFGTATDSQDLTGQTVSTHQLTPHERDALIATDFARVRQETEKLCDIREQLPPMHSAIKHQGQPLYRYARKGQTVERKMRRVTVHSATLEKVWLQDHVVADLCIECSKGTYIRTLVDELGKRLGYHAHAARLIRTRCGPFRLDDALDPDWLFSRQEKEGSELTTQLRREGTLLTLADAFDGWPSVTVDAQAARKLICGQFLPIEPDNLAAVAGHDRFTVIHGDELIAVARSKPRSDGTMQLKTERVFIDRADFERYQSCV